MCFQRVGFWRPDEGEEAAIKVESERSENLVYAEVG